MKKLMLVAVFGMALGFTSCGSDDDGGSSSCEECSVLGLADLKICDAGDGNVEVTTTALGQTNTETIELPEGTTFAEYAEQNCSGFSL